MIYGWRVLAIATVLFMAATGYGQEKKPPQRPPAKVVVSDVTTGLMAPEAEFVGTVYYQEVSDLAAEVDGRVETVSFEEGQRVRRGDILVTINADLLKKDLQATQASYEQVLTSLEMSRKDLGRNEQLFEEELLSEREYDNYRYVVKGFEKQALSLKADVERLEMEMKKKSISSPFDGVVLQRHVDRGEWLSSGSPVATIGKDDVVDIVVDLPERVVAFVSTGLDVEVRAGGRQAEGRVFALVPRGNVSTRTFPAKIRLENRSNLIEGMEARVRLPVGKKRESLVVDRDAVLTMAGTTVLYAVVDNKAVKMEVEVVGYEGLKAGVLAEGLREGMKVVIKGNERLRQGQAVTYSGDGAPRKK